jgi:hypothetical protein
MNGAAKSTLIGCCILTLLLCSSSASMAQRRSLTRKQAERYLRNLPAIEKVELVKFKQDENVRDSQIERSTFVEGAQARKIGSLWRTQTYGPDKSVCHYPAYAVRFYVKGQPLVYATVCWACNNILFFAPDFQGGLHFDGDDKNGQQLLEMFKEAFSETGQAQSSPGISFNPSSKKQ